MMWDMVGAFFMIVFLVAVGDLLLAIFERIFR